MSSGVLIESLTLHILGTDPQTLHQALAQVAHREGAFFTALARVNVAQVTRGAKPQALSNSV